MLKKAISYENLDGKTVTEEFLFHLSKADIIELEFAADGSLSDKLERIVASEDNHQIYQEFKKIILAAYGTRSEDGNRFIKSDAIRAEFEGTEAFSSLIMELLENEEAAAEFVAAIIPSGLNKTSEASTASEPIKEPIPTVPRELSSAEMREMDHDELASGLATGRYTLSPE